MFHVAAFHVIWSLHVVHVSSKILCAQKADVFSWFVTKKLRYECIITRWIRMGKELANYFTYFPPFLGSESTESAIDFFKVYFYLEALASFKMLRTAFCRYIAPQLDAH